MLRTCAHVRVLPAWEPLGGGVAGPMLSRAHRMHGIENIRCPQCASRPCTHLASTLQGPASGLRTVPELLKLSPQAPCGRHESKVSAVLYFLERSWQLSLLPLYRMPRWTNLG